MVGTEDEATAIDGDGVVVVNLSSASLSATEKLSKTAAGDSSEAQHAGEGCGIALYRAPFYTALHAVVYLALYFTLDEAQVGRTSR